MLRRIAGPFLALLLLVAACGDDADSADTTSTAAVASQYPVTVMGVEISQAPQRIVSASATHTEMLYAMGAGGAIIATDTFSDFPEAAAATEKIDAFNLNVEAVAALDPDLVVLGFDPGDAAAGLATLGIPVLLFDAPAELEDVWVQIDALGMATDTAAGAEALIEEMKSALDRVLESVATGDTPFTYYHELDPTYFTVTSATFLGELYGLLGLENIADSAADAGFGYPQLNAEFILGADPDFIFLADTLCCGMTAETLAERPGWDSLTAVASGNVIELDDSIASRWGPRIVEFLETVAEAIAGGGAG
jgi:iron complex transport system substrate-binding protein